MSIVIPSGTKSSHHAKGYKCFRSARLTTTTTGFEMTKAKGFGTNTSELATAEDTAIAVQAISPAPIAADTSAQWEQFTARPAVAATGKAFKATATGFKTVWDEELTHEYGKSFVLWGFGVLKAIALPLLSLIWLALNTFYVWVRKPETRRAAAARWQSFRAWLEQKFNYERKVDGQTEPKL